MSIKRTILGEIREMISDVMKAAMRPHVKFDGIQPHEPRPEGQRVVLLFTRTGVVRLFEKLDSVGNWYSASTYEHSVYVSHRQMAAKLTNATMLKCIGRLDLRRMELAERGGVKGVDLALVLWDCCQLYGNFVSREFPQQNARESDSRKFQVNLTLLSSPEGQAKLEKQPKQCKVVAEAFKRNAVSVMSDDEVDSLARQTCTAGLLKTKQDPCRIFRYYLPVLAELGMVEYRTRRVRDDDEEESTGEVAA